MLCRVCWGCACMRHNINGVVKGAHAYDVNSLHFVALHL